MKRSYVFHSMLGSRYLLTRIQEESQQSDLLIGQPENAFNLRIDGHHGYQVFYKACISADGNGGSLIEGEIINVPWGEDKKRTKFQKVMDVIGCTLGCIVLSPALVLILIMSGFYRLFLLLKNKGKKELTRAEKNLLYFMLDKLCCTEIND